MNRYIVGVAGLMLCVVIFAGVSSGGDARFKGGGYDGYDQSVCIQFDTNAANLVYARFKGGSYDGYDWNLVEDTTVRSGIPAGTVFEFW